MIIGIIPTIRSPYKNQIEITFDKRLINFFEKLNTKITIKLLNESSKINRNFDLIVFPGGNDLLKFSNLKEDKYRNKIDNYCFAKAKKLKIPMLGICYGATYAAYKFNAEFMKQRKIGRHKINFLENNFFNIKKKIVIVNSFKNYSIKKINKKVEILSLDQDKTIEAFFINKIKFLGLMWHPERNKKFRKLDFDLIKNLI
jgi:N5-(cytidine 5'-diphosphoramidyl)-L-glutamine hydrolase